MYHFQGVGISDLDVKNYIQRRTHCEKACCNLRWFFVNARTAWLACVLDRALQCQGRENYSRLFPTKVHIEPNLVWWTFNWGTSCFGNYCWVPLVSPLVGVPFGGEEVPEYSDQLNAKDKKIIHDYSQQGGILNQTPSGEPVIGNFSFRELSLGCSYWGTFFGGRGIPNTMNNWMLRTRKLFMTIHNKGVFWNQPCLLNLLLGHLSLGASCWGSSYAGIFCWEVVP